MVGKNDLHLTHHNLTTSLVSTELRKHDPKGGDCLVPSLKHYDSQQRSHETCKLCCTFRAALAYSVSKQEQEVLATNL